MEEGENIDKVLGKVYGGSNTEERNRLDTEIILQGAQYDTSNTTFPLQLVANTTLRGTSELRNEWVELDSKFNSPILLINEISGVSGYQISISTESDMSVEIFQFNLSNSLNNLFIFLLDIIFG